MMKTKALQYFTSQITFPEVEKFVFCKKPI
ncbi:MAG: hypothetical protein JWR61_2988 [Ferruginibacter sp.]|nr:hypothetical protein [Ferruginibacter sp.]